MGLQNGLIELYPRLDQYGNKLHYAKYRAPMTLHFKQGVAFFIYLSEENGEEMRIACANEGSECDSIKKRMKPGTHEINRYIIKLTKRIDQHDKPYYMAIVQDDSLDLDLSKEGVVFFVFTSKEGAEELQIGKNEHLPTQQHGRNENYTNAQHGGPEILRRGGSSGEVKKASDSGDWEAPMRPRRAAGY